MKTLCVLLSISIYLSSQLIACDAELAAALGSDPSWSWQIERPDYLKNGFTCEPVEHCELSEFEVLTISDERTEFQMYSLLTDGGFAAPVEMSFLGGTKEIDGVLKSNSVQWLRSTVKRKDVHSDEPCKCTIRLYLGFELKASHHCEAEFSPMLLREPVMYTAKLEFRGNNCLSWEATYYYHRLKDADDPTTTTTVAPSGYTDDSSTTTVTPSHSGSESSSTTTTTTTTPFGYTDDSSTTTVTPSHSGSESSTTTTTPFDYTDDSSTTTVTPSHTTTSTHTCVCPPMPSCVAGGYSLDLMVHMEDSFQMHVESHGLLEVEVPPFLRSLDRAFTSTSLGFVSYGDKPIEPFGQKDLDYCFKQHFGLSPLDERTLNMFSDQMKDIRMSPNSGRDYLEDVFGSLHYTTSTTNWHGGDSVLRVNVVFAEKLWHEAGDAQKLEQHPGTVPKGLDAADALCTAYDYVSQDVLFKALKDKDVATMIMVTAHTDPMIKNVYSAVARDAREYYGVKMYVVGTEDGVADGLARVFDRLCKDTSKEDSACERGDFTDIFTRPDENRNKVLEYLYPYIRQTAALVYPQQPLMYRLA